MREIKFRAWSKGLKEMFVNCDINHNGDVTFAWNPKEGSETQIESYAGTKYETDCIPMQYTGLKDSNGKDIYEGDIVDNVVFNGGSCYDLPQKIYFEDGCFCVGMGYIVDVKSMEVIGNVYENDYMLDKLSK